MTITDSDLIELHPLKQQKIAEDMESKMSIEEKINKVIRFTLITPIAVVICTWLDPHMGYFQMDGREDKGFFTINSLPEGSMITGNRYEEK